MVKNNIDLRGGGVFCMDARNAVLIPELSHTVQAKNAGGRSLNCTPNVIYPQDNVRCLNPWDHESYRVYDSGGGVPYYISRRERSGNDA